MIIKTFNQIELDGTEEYLFSDEKGMRVDRDLRNIFRKRKYIELESLLNYIERARDEGNLVGEKGFSASLFLSELIKNLEKER